MGYTPLTFSEMKISLRLGLLVRLRPAGHRVESRREGMKNQPCWGEEGRGVHGEYGAHEYLCARGTQITVCMEVHVRMVCMGICMHANTYVWYTWYVCVICRSHVQACSLGLLCLCTYEHASPCVCCQGWYWFRCGKCRYTQVGACRRRKCGSECVDLYAGL